MKKIKVQLAFLLLISSFVFFSCASDTITNNSNVGSSQTINVRLVDMNGISASNAYVSINNSEGIPVSIHGNASISGISVPYDLLVYSLIDSAYTLYKGLTTLNPQVTLYGTYGYSAPTQVASVLLIYPGSNYVSQRWVYSNFVSSINVFPRQDFINDSTTFFDLGWDGNSSINGSFCSFLDSLDYAGYTLFNGFAKKDTQFISGSVNIVKLARKDYSFKPVSSFVRVNQPSGIQNGFYHAEISFDGSSINSGILLDENYLQSGQALNLIVPGTLPTAYKIKTHIMFSLPDNSNFDYIGYLIPGSSVNVTVPAFPTQLYPVDNATGINYNTTFSYSPAGGVYLTSIRNFQYYGHFVLTVVSAVAAFSIPDLSQKGFRLSGNKHFAWYVTAEFGFSGIDDFASSKRFTNDSHYSGSTETSERSFYSAP